MNTEREALKNLVKAWEALPGGDYGSDVVERWLKESMSPAINAAHAVLAEEGN